MRLLWPLLIETLLAATVGMADTIMVSSVGAHAGAGCLWNVSGNTSLDFHAKYFWTQQGSDSVTLSTGDRVRFSAVNSHRARLGGRFSFAAGEYVSPYAGAAFEYEFHGKARAKTNRLAIDAPSLRGGTGIGELGLMVKPSSTVSIDLGAQGYVGKREGVTGALQVGIAF